MTHGRVLDFMNFSTDMSVEFRLTSFFAGGRWELPIKSPHSYKNMNVSKIVNSTIVRVYIKVFKLFQYYRIFYINLNRSEKYLEKIDESFGILYQTIWLLRPFLKLLYMPQYMCRLLRRIVTITQWHHISQVQNFRSLVVCSYKPTKSCLKSNYIHCKSNI